MDSSYCEMPFNSNKGSKSLEYGRKLEILNEVLAEEQTGKVNFTAIGRKFNVDRTTVARISKSRARLVEIAGKGFNLSHKRERNIKERDVDETLFVWYKKELSQNIRPSLPVLKQKATELAHEMGHDFVPSSSWITRFKERHRLRERKDKGVRHEVEVADIFKERSLTQLLQWSRKRELQDSDEVCSKRKAPDNLDAPSSSKGTSNASKHFMSSAHTSLTAGDLTASAQPAYFDPSHSSFRHVRPRSMGPTGLHIESVDTSGASTNSSEQEFDIQVIKPERFDPAFHQVDSSSGVNYSFQRNSPSDWDERERVGQPVQLVDSDHTHLIQTNSSLHQELKMTKKALFQTRQELRTKQREVETLTRKLKKRDEKLHRLLDMVDGYLKPGQIFELLMDGDNENENEKSEIKIELNEDEAEDSDAEQ